MFHYNLFHKVPWGVKLFSSVIKEFHKDRAGFWEGHSQHVSGPVVVTSMSERPLFFAAAFNYGQTERKKGFILEKLQIF